ncbi:MAG: Bax inhibitor-1/YccA family protein [Acholeplasmatales bacterium]|nr:Bax inhibitor-1/YccA family protein [Acholeplasmatales bacterium]
MRSPLYSKVETSSTYLEKEKDRATIGGIVGKTFGLVLITTIIATTVSILLIRVLTYHPVAFIGLLFLSSILSLIFAIGGRLSVRLTKYFSVGYALTEGVLVGTITGIVEAYVSGAGIICAFSTLIIYLSLLVLYRIGFIRTDSKEGINILNIVLRLMIAFLLIGFVLAIFTSIVYLFRDVDKDFFYIMILIEAIFLLYGIFSLTLSFGEASAVVNSGCSKASEWQVALGMEISLIYIYIRMLRIVLYIAAKGRK